MSEVKVTLASSGIDGHFHEIKDDGKGNVTVKTYDVTAKNENSNEPFKVVGTTGVKTNS